MKDRYHFYCYNPALENFLMENGMKPCKYVGDDIAVFKQSKKLRDLLDGYWIRHKVFKMYKES